MVEPWVTQILADPITKLPSTPEQIGLHGDVIDARRYLRNTFGFSNWDEGQVFYEAWDKRTIEDYRAEIGGVTPVYDHIRMSGSVLDVGGGAGIVRHFLPPGTKFLSVDPFIDCEKGLSAAKRAAYPCLSTHLNFIAACAEFLPLQSATFDWVHMRSMLDHTHSPDLALMEARRVLKPGGRLVIGLFVDGGKSGRRTLRLHVKEIARTILVTAGIDRYRDHHTFHPTFANLLKIIADNGFSVIDVYWQPQWKGQVCYVTAEPVRSLAKSTERPAQAAGFESHFAPHCH